MGPTISIQQSKKQMCDLGRDSRQQFKKMRAYWKTFRLTNLIYYNNYLVVMPLARAWRGLLSFLVGQMRDRYQASTNAQFVQSHYKFVSAIPHIQLYLFKLKGRMVLCTQLKSFNVDRKWLKINKMNERIAHLFGTFEKLVLQVI